MILNSLPYYWARLHNHIHSLHYQSESPVPTHESKMTFHYQVRTHLLNTSKVKKFFTYSIAYLDVIFCMLFIFYWVICLFLSNKYFLCIQDPNLCSICTAQSWLPFSHAFLNFLKIFKLYLLRSRETETDRAPFHRSTPQVFATAGMEQARPKSGADNIIQVSYVDGGNPVTCCLQKVHISGIRESKGEPGIESMM